MAGRQQGAGLKAKLPDARRAADPHRQGHQHGEPDDVGTMEHAAWVYALSASLHTHYQRG